MRTRPRSRFEDEYGCVGSEGLALIASGVPEYPEVVAWEKEYKEGCDRLSELEAEKTRKRHWGRWYLNQSKPPSLDTKDSRPGIGCYSDWCGDVYDIMLHSCRTERDREFWVEHMKEKNWMGAKGLAGLRRAFDDLMAAGILPANEVILRG